MSTGDEYDDIQVHDSTGNVFADLGVSFPRVAHAGTQYDVVVFHDDEAGVWVATSEDIPGLVTEADTYEQLVDRICAVTPELLQDNARHLAKACVGPVKLNMSHRVNLGAAAFRGSV